MARIARVVVENYPHHIIQRGNRKQKVFFKKEDYQEYLALLEENAEKNNVDILTYCLMPNHIHLIAVPCKNGNLAQAIGETHRKYTRYINFREEWRGYLWQGRFSSYVLDQKYLLAALRYILLNPVKAKLVSKAYNYQWSSIKQHIDRGENKFIKDKLLQRLINNWKDFLSTESEAEDVKIFQTHERTGRPLGNRPFLSRVEQILGRDLKRQKPGPKKKTADN
ncbi:MAG: transposase [Candidatus Omnitrophica bacterium]|nr:transposase [Candidatus Omnitrophota bacterium]